MSQSLFPKPAPDNPLLLNDYLNRTDRAEVGRSAFFCGRDAEYGVFQNAASRLYAGEIGGGTIVFQGAPGAGKTALMLECMESVKRHSTPDEPWVAVSINPGTLQSPVSVVLGLINAANQESKRLSKMASETDAHHLRKLLELGAKFCEELSARGFGIAGLSVGGKSEAGSDQALAMPAAQAFQEAVPLLKTFRLVVFVDEAQNTPVSDASRDVLDCIHRDAQGIPLVAAFFGLSNTQQVLRECGLSRFADQRVVNLEPLSIANTFESFQRMLDTYFTGEEEEKAKWADALAELSQGWPQHINRVGVAAARVIHANKSHLESHLLEQALERGTERKNDYYKGRLEAGSNRVWVYKKLALAAGEKKGKFANTLSYDEIDLLTEAARKRKDESIEEFLTNALHAGLLTPARDMLDQYKFPIPSLGDYLRASQVEPPQTT